MAKIDITIVTYNAGDKLRRCFQSLKKCTKGIEYSLSVVDNHSTDGAFAFLKRYQEKNKKVEVISSEKN